MSKVPPAARVTASAPVRRAPTGATDLSLKTPRAGQRVALLRLKFASNPELLGVVRSAVCALSESIGFSPEASRAVIRSVDEALANVMRHAYGSRRDQPIHLTCWSVASKLPQGAKAALEIVIMDRGIPMPEGKLNAPPPPELRAGGLGLEWMRKSMDVVEHSRKGKTNSLRMLKYAV
ncbi:MAG TPA: ATP-binding protein [Candidatus Dormibacteraeota bacterium]|nr:ATP-binding protein [Candidatus Dormibacteraeota bacterium]